jgi:hypothetical protein
MKTSDVVTTWHSKDGQEWRLTFTLAEVRGRRECIAFQIEPSVGFIDHEGGEFHSDHADDASVLSATVLRDMRFTSELALAQRETAAAYRIAGEMAASAAEQRVPPGGTRDEIRAAHIANGEREAAFVEAPLGTKSGRRTKYGSEDYERVAAAYKAAIAASSTSPTADVARQLGLGHNQAAKLVQRCRQLRILDPAPAGQRLWPQRTQQPEEGQ